MHVGRTRYMKCPECNEKSWQKKVISKFEGGNIYGYNGTR